MKNIFYAKKSYIQKTELIRAIIRSSPSHKQLVNTKIVNYTEKYNLRCPPPDFFLDPPMSVCVFVFVFVPRKRVS